VGLQGWKMAVMRSRGYGGVTDPVLEKWGIRVDARDISISFRRNAAVKFKDVLEILPTKRLLDSIYF